MFGTEGLGLVRATLAARGLAAPRDVPSDLGPLRPENPPEIQSAPLLDVVRVVVDHLQDVGGRVMDAVATLADDESLGLHHLLVTQAVGVADGAKLFLLRAPVEVVCPLERRDGVVAASPDGAAAEEPDIRLNHDCTPNR
jgi:hypothetical protein